MPQTFHPADIITTEAQLADILGRPSQTAVRKQLHSLDTHCRAFIERSPFMLLGTSSGLGADVSPKGDRPGFVLVLDESTLVIPDRLGNRRADSHLNILRNPEVGLLFLVPGFGETLRVNGHATIVRDAGLLEKTAAQGKRPQLCIVVTVREAYLHCAKAMIRSSLWKPESWPERSALPDFARMLMDQTGRNDCTVDDMRQQISESYATRLY
jgi:hypothetical protein